MSPDEQAIRSLVALWHIATAAGDVDTVLGLFSVSWATTLSSLFPVNRR
jgi:hypothetical protein